MDLLASNVGAVSTLDRATQSDPLGRSPRNRAASSNRLHWLAIDKLGSAAGDAELPDIERRLPGAAGLLVGFPRHAPSGRVEVKAEGNEIEIRSRGVRRLRLLLSPRQFNLSRPLRVLVNGVELHLGVVTPDRGTLLRWAARDLDRSMLFAAELEIRIPAFGGPS